MLVGRWYEKEPLRNHMIRRIKSQRRLIILDLVNQLGHLRAQARFFALPGGEPGQADDQPSQHPDNADHHQEFDERKRSDAPPSNTPRQTDPRTFAALGL